MTWQLMWCNVRVAALNATFKLLVIYRLGAWLIIYAYINVLLFSYYFSKLYYLH